MEMVHGTVELKVKTPPDTPNAARAIIRRALEVLEKTFGLGVGRGTWAHSETPDGVSIAKAGPRGNWTAAISGGTVTVEVHRVGDEELDGAAAIDRLTSSFAKAKIDLAGTPTVRGKTTPQEATPQKATPAAKPKPKAPAAEPKDDGDDEATSTK